MKERTIIIITVLSALAFLLLNSGCAGLGSGQTSLQNIITPATLQLAAENGTYLALEKQPQLLQPFEGVVTGITNATAGGTLTLNANTLTGTLTQLGFGGLANQPGAALLLDDIAGLTAQFDAQQGTNSILSNTNIVPALNAVAAGMERGIQIYRQ